MGFSVNRMKIFLVDFFVNGHHVEHAGYLGCYLLEQGHEVTFAIWQPDDRVRVLSDIGLNVRYLADRQVPLSSNTSDGELSWESQP